MVENKSIVKSLNFFYKIIGDLENIEVKINDEDKPLLFLISLHRLFEHFKNVLISSDEVYTTVISKKFSKGKDLNIDDSDEGLSVSK